MGILFSTDEEKIGKAQTKLELQRLENQRAKEEHENRMETDNTYRLKKTIGKIAGDTGTNVAKALSRVYSLPYTAVNYVFDTKTEKIAEDFTRVVNVLSGVTGLIPPEAFNAMIGVISSLDPKVAMALKGAYAILAGIEKNKKKVKNGAEVRKEIVENAKVEDRNALAEVNREDIIAAIGQLGGLTPEQKDSFKTFTDMAKQVMPKKEYSINAKPKGSVPPKVQEKLLN